MKKSNILFRAKGVNPKNKELKKKEELPPGSPIFRRVQRELSSDSSENSGDTKKSVQFQIPNKDEADVFFDKK